MGWLRGGMLTFFSLGLAAQVQSVLTLGLEQRVRSEDWNNLSDFDSARPDGRTQYRFRTRVWADWRPTEAFSFVAGVNGEYRWITRPDLPVPSREVCFDTLYADWRPGPDWSVRIGRQGITRGEGFILLDGTPLDGSRTAFFDAMVGTWKGAGGSLEAMVIRNGRTDRLLPRFNEPRDPRDQQRLAEWDERAFALYYTRPGFYGEGGQLEAYALRVIRSQDYRAPVDIRARPDRTVDVFGGRMVLPLGSDWSLTSEGAVQRGDQRSGAQGMDELPLRAWGGYTRLKRSWNHPWKPTASLGVVALSGDDPATRTLEGWDPLFGRWPKWSELYIYTLAGEGGVASWSNLGMEELEGRLAPRKGVEIRVTYYRMLALRRMAGRGAAFGIGKGRGDLYQARVDMVLNPNWKGHAVYERLLPGDFHAGRNGAHFLRFEATWTGLWHR